MGLTKQSTGFSLALEKFDIVTDYEDKIVIGLAGNPNTGKSTLFNELTGLKQHTGNWPGKTVQNARGTFKYNDQEYLLVDLPGTYSLLANSVEEEVARDFICFGDPTLTIVVTDATCLERNLNLALQVMEITDKVIICLNLIDEAEKKGINIDVSRLSEQLGVPVIPTVARDGKGIDELLETVVEMAMCTHKTNPLRLTYDEDIESVVEKIQSILEETMSEEYNTRWLALRLIDGDNAIRDSLQQLVERSMDDATETSSADTLAEIDQLVDHALPSDSVLGDKIVSSIYRKAEEVAEAVVTVDDKRMIRWDRKLDNVLTSRLFGYPVMLLMLGVVFWITIKGANVPSQMLANMFFGIEEYLSNWFITINAPAWLHGILVLGVYRTLAWVISVMLPPMAIFFPLFTLLEDLGYLPRVAFNLDNLFRKACTHGKQALTMCMGFGCNAAGIISCRIIDSPRERLIATLTNNFVPCNGRFPTLIAISSIFMGTALSARYSSVMASFSVVVLVVFSVGVTLAVSRILSKTILKGVPSSFKLEMPPYRRPQIGKVLVRSLLDRTLFVLGRAIMVAAPAGLLIWVFANITVSGMSVLGHCIAFFEPFGKLLGLDGAIIMAFLLGLPANEIVLPILIMSYMSKGAMLELDSLSALKDLLVANGWTWVTGLNFMLFSLLHFPCATTILTIKKETNSVKWALMSVVIPTIAAIVVTLGVNVLAHLFGLV